MNLFLRIALMTGLTRAARFVPGSAPHLSLWPLLASAFFWILQYSGRKGDVYNILWALVFGFATLNILGLVARRFEPNRSRLTFGEVLAIGVVVMAVFLLGWEMLHLFRVLPIKLSPR